MAGDQSRAQQGDEVERPLKTAANVQQQPGGFTRHVFMGQAAESGELHDQLADAFMQSPATDL